MEDLEIPQFDSVVFHPENGLVIAYFWGKPCSNCERARRELAWIEPELAALDVKVYGLNVYENPEIATRFGLVGVPSFLFVKAGKAQGRVTGFPGREEFLRLVRSSA